MPYCENVGKMKKNSMGKKSLKYEIYNGSKNKYIHPKITIEDVVCIWYDNPCNLPYIL